MRVDLTPKNNLKREIGVSQARFGTSNPSAIIDFSEKPKTLLVDTVLPLCIYGLGMKAIELAVKHMPFYYASLPANWFPSTLAVLAVIICLQIWAILHSKKRIHACLYLVFALFSMVLSMYYGADIKKWLYVLDGSGLPLRQFINGGFIIATVILGVIISLQAKEWWSRIGTFVWAILLGFSFLGFGRTKEAGALDFVAFAFPLVSLLAHLHRWQSSEEL